MQHSYHNHSQPILSTLQQGGNNNNEQGKNVPEYRYGQNETTINASDECSILLNALSFRESTVAYADRLYLNPQPPKIAEDYLNTNHSIETSVSDLLGKELRQGDNGNLIAENRDLVVNWIALIHTKYWFEQETFHLAVSIIDRYLKKILDGFIDF